MLQLTNTQSAGLNLLVCYRNVTVTGNKGTETVFDQQFQRARLQLCGSCTWTFHNITVANDSSGSAPANELFVAGQLGARVILKVSNPLPTHPHTTTTTTTKPAHYLAVPPRGRRPCSPAFVRAMRIDLQQHHCERHSAPIAVQPQISCWWQPSWVLLKVTPPPLWPLAQPICDLCGSSRWCHDLADLAQCRAMRSCSTLLLQDANVLRMACPSTADTLGVLSITPRSTAFQQQQQQYTDKDISIQGRTFPAAMFAQSFSTDVAPTQEGRANIGGYALLWQNTGGPRHGGGGGDQV
jgi:hypothetical protein